MTFSKQNRLFLTLLCLLFGLLMYIKGYNSKKIVSSYQTGNQSVTVIDLSPIQNTSYNWYYVGGTLLFGASLFFATRNESISKQTTISTGVEKLTNQEQKIAQLIHQKMSNKEIAQQLSISVSTVKTHINNIYKKYDVNSRANFLKITQNKGF